MVIHRRKILVAPAAVLFSASSRADLYDDYINSTSKETFVAFLGRAATPSTIGHAFVAIGVRLDATLLVYERLFGLYPKEGSLAAIKSIFGPVSGKLDSIWADLSWDTELRRAVDESQRAAALAQFEKWKSNAPEYSLVGNGGINCNGLVGDVARSVGMKVPNGADTTRPWRFIEALKAAN